MDVIQELTVSIRVSVKITPKNSIDNEDMIPTII